MTRGIRQLWRRYFLTLDLTLVGIVVGIIVASYFLGYSSLMSYLLERDWSSIYRLTTSVAAALLGFSLTVTSIVLGFSTSESLRILRQSTYYPVLWETFFSTIRFLGYLGIWSWICFVVDNGLSSPIWMKAVLLFLVLGSTVRLARSVGIIHKIINIVASPMQ